MSLFMHPCRAKYKITRMSIRSDLSTINDAMASIIPQTRNRKYLFGYGLTDFVGP